MTVSRVKDFPKGPTPKCGCGGPVMKKAEGGHVDIAQDKAMIKSAVHKHEKAQHPGKPLTALKRGGRVTEAATGETYPSCKAMIKHEALETPTVQKEEVIQRATLKGRRGVPVAPTRPLVLR